MPAPTSPLRHDAQVIGFVGVAHGFSHFFQLMLPPLFPMLKGEFETGYAELGLVMAVFYAVSGLMQTVAGFLVDRWGAHRILVLGLGCAAIGAMSYAIAPSYPFLIVGAVIGGLGNSVFHPGDLALLNAKVSTPRLGYAFSVHGIGGNLGWAAAPVFMAALTAATGSWRWAAAGAALWASSVLATMVLNRHAIDDRSATWPHAGAAKAVAASAEHPLAFLRLPSVWLCFSFFFWSTCALSAVQSFAGPALQQLHGLPLSITSFVVTGFMLCGAAGMAVGGFLAARGQRLERTIGACLLGAALLLFVAGLPGLPGLLAAGLAALAGFGTGLAGPSRDMLIKRAAPPGATGRVYGTVYSGLDLGFALAAPVFGAIMDRGAPSGVFGGAALALVAGVVSATLVGARVARGQGAAAKMPA